MLTIDRVLQHDSLRDFAKEKSDRIIENLKNVEVLADKDKTTPGGLPVWEYVVKFSMDAKLALYKKYVFAIHDKMGFTFNCDFSKESYIRYNKEVENLINWLLPGTYGAR